MEKTCVDCNHHSIWYDKNGFAQHYCNFFDRSKIDVVTGNVDYTGNYCYLLRTNIGVCGVEGRFWQPKQQV